MVFIFNKRCSVYLSAESGLRSCLLSSSNNELQCGSTYNSDSLLHPGGLALSPDGQTAYVIDDSEAPGVTVCPISNGSFSCSSMTGINLYNPKAIAVSPDGLYAYITDAASGNVTICTINGSSLTCGQQKGGFNQPWGIALSPDGKSAFITDSSAISYTSCSVSGSTLDTCMMKPLITTDVNQQGEPQGIALSPDGKTAFIAMSQGNAGINVCNVTDTTIFCTSPAVNPDCLFTNPQYVALTKDGSKLAVTTSNGNGTVVVCDVNNQAIDNCNANQITWPQGVAAF